MDGVIFNEPAIHDRDPSALTFWGEQHYCSITAAITGRGMNNYSWQFTAQGARGILEHHAATALLEAMQQQRC